MSTVGCSLYLGAIMSSESSQIVLPDRVRPMRVIGLGPSRSVDNEELLHRFSTKCSLTAA